MVKEVYFFTEMGHTAYPQDEARRLGYNNLLFPNAHFSPERAQALYSTYFEELQYCTEAGFDGVMINEHHNNPLRVAEELAMIDILSGGRVVCGFVRGTGQESLATNTNPVYNRERFDEAHDLILKAWTTPGPFRWEGKHYHYRIVNPWVRPLQRPHPPIWIPGVASPESVRWAAEHRYPYVALAPALDLLEEIYGLYDEVAAAAGFTPTAEHRGYAIRVSVADSDEEAYEQGKHFFWQLGTSFGVAPRHWQAPPGYLSWAAAQGRRVQPWLRGGSCQLPDRLRQPRHRAQEAAAHHRPGGPGIPDPLGSGGADVA
jgi:Luciferase-like monooxygenase